MRDMVKNIMKKRKKGDHEGTEDVQHLAKEYDDSDMHDDDFLSQDGDEFEPELEHASNELGNEDDSDNRKNALKKIMGNRQRVAPLLRRGSKTTPDGTY